jgi:hypothetical protein
MNAPIAFSTRVFTDFSTGYVLPQLRYVSPRRAGIERIGRKHAGCKRARRPLRGFRARPPRHLPIDLRYDLPNVETKRHDLLVFPACRIYTAITCHE